MPRPPQTESRSTPSWRAAVSTGVPAGKRPRLPEGVKITSGSVGTVTTATSKQGPDPILADGSSEDSRSPAGKWAFAAFLQEGRCGRAETVGQGQQAFIAGQGRAGP